MGGMRSALEALSKVRPTEMRGVRAPRLAIGGDNQFQMMKSLVLFYQKKINGNFFRQGFMYDNSMSVNPGRTQSPYWPQTLDYSMPWSCEIPPCPQRSYPGIWELPINQFYGYYLPSIQQHNRAAMVRAAILPEDTVDSVVQMLNVRFFLVSRKNDKTRKTLTVRTIQIVLHSS